MANWTASGNALLQDVQFALRAARKSPGFVLTAACTLALGIGANTAIFSLVSGVLLRPLPFEHPERLVQINSTDARFANVAVYYRDITEWRQQSQTIEGIAGYGNSSRTLLEAGEPDRVQTTWSERNLFTLLGAAPLAGRTFQADDPLEVTVISESLWRRRFGADPACIGRKVMFDHDLFTIIGVMPDQFQFPYRAARTDAWIPWTAPSGPSRYSRVDNVVARLKPGASLEAARRELVLFAQRLEAQYPDTNRGRSAKLTPLTEVVVGKARAALLTLLGAVGLVLLIACANVANLLLARASGRMQEIAVRSALGASRWRVVQQLLTESLLLSLTGAVGGLLVAIGLSRLVLKLAAASIPRAWEVGLDWRVFLFLLGASVAAGIGFGLLPALAASRVDLQTAMKQGAGRAVGAGAGGWSGRRLRDGLVVVEVALSFVLLVSAGIVLRAFLKLQDTPAGLVTDRVLTLRLTVALRDYPAPGSFGRYLARIEERVRQIPGVRVAGFIQYLPLQNWGWGGSFVIRDRPPQAPGEVPLQSELRYVSPGYFEALRIPLRRGRLFNDRDTETAPRVILVNEALARKYFPNEDPLGRVTDRGTIIGLVGDVRASGLDRPATPEVYYSFVQNPAATADAGVSMVVSAHGRAETLARPITEAVRQVNPQQVVYDIKSMDRVVANSLADMNLYLWLIALFAALALLIAAIGIYSVIAYVVAARTQEFGLRLALGAERSHILRLVLGHGAALLAGGMVLGAAGTLAATRLLRAVLSGAAEMEPGTLAAVAGVLAAAGLAACLIPSLRAMDADPLAALKYE